MFRFGRLLLILLLLSLISGSAISGLPEVQTEIVGRGTRGPYLLGYENIISHSIRIYDHGVEIDSSSFAIGYIEGVLWFDDIIPLDDTLLASFNYLPITLQNQYYLHELKPGKVEDRTRKTETGGSVPSVESDIRISGSKGFIVETGRGSDQLSQSLNLNIKGELVPGLRTSAHISDKSGGGDAVTRRLDELDKIYIEAESRNFKGIFGDYDLYEQDQSLMSFRRKLTGLNLGYNDNNREFRGAAGFFPGEYRKIDIPGSDGRLGPYYLTDVNGKEGAQVLPGSERVYLDGELMSRGSEKDYTIDYISGAIQFSPTIVVRNESRITIEYEISREDYSRTFFAAAGTDRSVSGVTFFSKLIQEGDDNNSPKNFDMTEENRAIIENAGADPLNASKSGVIFRGPGEGDYNLIIDSLGSQYFAYAGANLGEYDVTFSFVGERMGSYVPRGGGVYEFVGSGVGDYEPVILLPIPQMRRYGTIGSSWKSEDERMGLYGEIAGSLNDRNTLSRVDETDKGTSGVARIEYSQNLIGSDAFAGIDAKTRKIGNGMIFPGRIDDVERYRDYDLQPDSSPEGEWLGEVSLQGGLDSEKKVSFLWGDLKRPGITRRKRLRGAFDWKITGPLRSRGHTDRVSGDRTWDKRDLEFAAAFEKIQPSVGLEYERRDGDSGFKFYEYNVRFPATATANLNGTTELNYRDEDALKSSWVDKFRSGYIKQNVEFVLGQSGLSGELNASYYKKTYQDQSGANSDQKSGWTRLNYNDPGERFDFKINERLSASNERVQARNFIFVGEGNGEYRLEDGEYIRDPNGEYILVLEELGEGQKITEVSSELYGSVRPLLFISSEEGIEESAGRLIIESELAYDQRKSNNRLIFADFVPWKKDNLDDLVFRNGRLDLRVFYYPPSSQHRLKYNMIRSYEDGQRFVNEINRDNLSSDEISWAFPTGEKLNFILTGFISRRQRQINQVSLNLRRHKESISTEYRFHESWSLRMEGEYENIRQKEADIISHIPSINSVLTRELGKRGRISANISYFRVIVRPEGSYIPYQVAGGKREGDNFEGGIRARVAATENGRFELTYRFEDFSMRPERQNLRLEFTLLFL